MYPRYLSNNLITALSDTPAVLLFGARQAGKTTLAKSELVGSDRQYVTLDDANALAIAQSDPHAFVDGLANPCTIDEVQRAPHLLPAVKKAIDENRQPGRFLLTGSANLLLLPQVSESLAGRSEVLNLSPLSQCEIGAANINFITRWMDTGFTPQIQALPEKPDPGELYQRVLAGGYPEAVARAGTRRRRWHRSYLQAIIERDVADIAQIRNADALQKLLLCLADRTATMLNITELGGLIGLKRETTEHYLLILERLFLVKRLPAWHANFTKRLTKTPKIYVVDSGLCASLSGFRDEQSIDNFTKFGPLLESFVVNELIRHADWLDSDLAFSHYRDKDKVEVDLVLERGNEIWAVEVKNSTSVSPHDGKGLKRLARLAGKRFKGGVVLYGGHDVFAIAPKIHAVPLAMLWTAPAE